MHVCSIWLPKILLSELKLALRSNKVVHLICGYGYCLYRKSNSGNQALSICKCVLVVLFVHTCHLSVVEKVVGFCTCRAWVLLLAFMIVPANSDSDKL